MGTKAESASNATETMLKAVRRIDSESLEVGRRFVLNVRGVES